MTILTCERGLDESQSNYLSGPAYLNTYSATPYCDLSVTSASYLEHSLVKGGTPDIVVDVANNGMAAAQMIQLQVLNDGELLSSATYADCLVSCQSGQHYISIPLDDPTIYTDLTVTAFTSGYTDLAEEDNTASAPLRLLDLSVEDSEVVGNTVRTLVVNRGQLGLNGITVTLYDDYGIGLQFRYRHSAGRCKNHF